MSKQPKEIRDIEKQLKVTTIAVRDLHARAMELGLGATQPERRTMNFSIAPKRVTLICGVKVVKCAVPRSGPPRFVPGGPFLFPEISPARFNLKGHLQPNDHCGSPKNMHAQKEAKYS
jgi:hypothetical protein